MANLPLGIKTHAQKVCSLYKKALRNLESFYDRRFFKFYLFEITLKKPEIINLITRNDAEDRYQAVLLRERFDKNAKLADMCKAAQLLKEGEEELFLKQHPIPKKFATSEGGVAHERIVTPPDWVLDYWHPLEKAQYPEYFKRREERKKEFIAMWEKEYGKPDPKDQHH